MLSYPVSESRVLFCSARVIPTVESTFSALVHAGTNARYTPNLFVFPIGRADPGNFTTKRAPLATSHTSPKSPAKSKCLTDNGGCAADQTCETTTAGGVICKCGPFQELVDGKCQGMPHWIIMILHIVYGSIHSRGSWKYETGW